MKIFCSGIGGIGLSAYASLQNKAGHQVSGSDRSMSDLLENLKAQGILVTTDQSGAAIPSDCDLFVYSEAIPSHAPERKRAQDMNILQQSYPQALGEISKPYTTIAVCGTHGKSSTTAMASRLLMEAHKDPTIVVGTKLKELGGKNWRKGESDLFLLEACEYRKSFSYYHPRVILLTNADGDHFDYYKSIDEYHRAFIEFIQLLPEDGVLITHMADPECAAIANTCGKNVIDADEYPLIQVQTPGMHMKQNAQLVLGLASYLKIPLSEAIKMVSQFTGSWRRMERKGTVNGAIVIDDYAHHPKEIRATISGIREWYTPRRLVCVFQPHTHDRTLKLYDEFVRSFSGADLVLITDVYEARKDIETAKVDIEAFSRDIQKYCKSEVVVTGSLESTEKYLKKNIQENDVLLCMGAGDITAMANTIIDAK